MTIPLSLPPISPGYNTVIDRQGQERAHADESLKTLLAAIANRRQADLEQQRITQAGQQAAQEVDTNNQAGEIVATLSKSLSLPSVPGGVIPNISTVPGGTAPVPVQRDMVADRLSRAFSNRPGTAIIKAYNAATNQISQAITRENDPKKPPPPPDSPYRTTRPGADGFLWGERKDTGRMEHVLDNQGKPFPMPKAGTQGKRVVRLLTDKNTGALSALMADKDGNLSQRPLPQNFVIAGTPGPAAYQAVNRYMNGVTAFADLAATGFPSIPSDVVSKLSAYARSKGPDSPLGIALTDIGLTPAQVRAVTAWTALVTGKTYKESGAAVTVSEFNRNISNLIPIDGELPEGKRLKIRFLGNSVRADRQQAQLANLVIPDPQDQPDIDEILQQAGKLDSIPITDPNLLDLLRELGGEQ